jgi:hypothetical protein
MDEKDDEIFAEFDYHYNFNDVGNELLVHILHTQSNLLAMRDLLIDIAAKVQQRDDEAVIKEYQEAKSEYARRLLTEWTGKYGKLKDDQKDNPPSS